MSRHRPRSSHTRNIGIVFALGAIGWGIQTWWNWDARLPFHLLFGQVSVVLLCAAGALCSWWVWKG
ncbi:MAG TPA: hypothetical protein VGK73_26865 [Polyangiaceae bacterium]